ncbi:MAG TPA: hypothetical protein VGP72_04885 [Planctomycetota bacterium]|jgi:hypothetical protein
MRISYRQFIGPARVALLGVLVCAMARAEDEADTQRFTYPESVWKFRAEALEHDGLFAPDIAFSIRDCPHCRNPYLLGTFPRLKRHAWDSLNIAHKMVEQTAVLKRPPLMMFSRKENRLVPRFCPLCGEPDPQAHSDRVLFCHVMPESGDDMQVEYEVKNLAVVKRNYWRMPAKSRKPVKLELADETEESIRKAYGCYFSLRAVWNGIFATEMDNKDILYRGVSPGMWFIFQSPTVAREDIVEFSVRALKADREKGLISRVESPLRIDPKHTENTIREWASKYNEQLGGENRAECFVAIAYPELHKAAETVLASRGLKLEMKEVAKPADAGKGVVSKGEYRTDILFGALASMAVQQGLSFHGACVQYLTEPAFLVLGADQLDRALREQYPDCSAEVQDGQYLVLRDRQQQERKVDILLLANRLNPEDRFAFELFCKLILAWNGETKTFGPKPAARDVSPMGMPAFIERRVRPPGFLGQKDLKSALYMPQQDADGNRFDLCYTSECATTLSYVDPEKERFKGMTMEDARRVYDSSNFAWPTYITDQDKLELPGDTPTKSGPCRVVVVCGIEIASLGAEDSRASCLARAVGFKEQDGERVHVYALSSNMAAVTTRKLTAEEFKLVKGRLEDLTIEHEMDPGYKLGLHFDWPRVEPRGNVMRKRR